MPPRPSPSASAPSSSRRCRSSRCGRSSLVQPRHPLPRQLPATVAVRHTTKGRPSGAKNLGYFDAVSCSAAASFAARDYNGALNTYLASESLIYAHLDPQWDPGLMNKFRPLLPRDPSLFDPLLSATCQWLDILPVPVSVSPVRPSIPVAAPLLSSVSGLYGAGISQVSANPAAAAKALSDMHLAAIFADQGNTAASTATVTQAQGLDATIATALAPPAPAAGAPKAPGAPVAPVAVATGTPAAPVTIAKPVGVGLPIASAAEPLAPSAAVAPVASLTRSPINLGGLSPVILRTPPIITLPQLPISLLAQKQAGLLTGAGTSFAVKTLQWSATGSPDIATIKSIMYAPHVTAIALPDALMNATSLWERALLLPHDYFYVIPMAIARCYQALGDYAQAETYYLQAAAYPYLNTQTEGPYLWASLATLYSQWGNDVYQQGDAVTAATIYGKVITPGSTTAPSTPLYTLTGLATAAQIAKTMLPELASLAANGVSSVAANDVAVALRCSSRSTASSARSAPGLTTGAITRRRCLSGRSATSSRWRLSLPSWPCKPRTKSSTSGRRQTRPP